MDKQRVFTVSHVAQHKSKDDCWFIIDGRVVDATNFLEEHPGGEEVLMQSAGKDATKDFEDIGHSKAAKKLLLKFQIGFLQGYNHNESYKVSEVETMAASKESNMPKEMKAFVIKEDPVFKYTSLIEFFVPLLVAGFFFGYKYLTGSTLLGS